MNDRQKKTAISIRGLIKRYPDGTVSHAHLSSQELETSSPLFLDRWLSGVYPECPESNMIVEFWSIIARAPAALRISIGRCPKHIVWSTTAQAKASLQARLWKP